MMTTQPDNACDTEIWNRGTAVFGIASLPSTAIEAIVVRCREETGEKVDWHYFSGLGIIKCIGDDAACTKVTVALERITPEWERLFMPPEATNGQAGLATVQHELAIRQARIEAAKEMRERVIIVLKGKLCSGCEKIAELEPMSSMCIRCGRISKSIDDISALTIEGE